MPSKPEKHAAYMRTRYNSDPEFRDRIKKHAADSNKRNRERVKEVILEWKNSGCSACTEMDPCCLVAHHLNPEEKEDAISNMGKFSLKRVREELAKCICLCANCHMKLHAGHLTLSG